MNKIFYTRRYYIYFKLYFKSQSSKKVISYLYIYIVTEEKKNYIV